MLKLIARVWMLSLAFFSTFWLLLSGYYAHIILRKVAFIIMISTSSTPRKFPSFLSQKMWNLSPADETQARRGSFNQFAYFSRFCLFARLGLWITKRRTLSFENQRKILSKISKKTIEILHKNQSEIKRNQSKINSKSMIFKSKICTMNEDTEPEAISFVTPSSDWN